jgi:hypothetical protein
MLSTIYHQDDDWLIDSLTRCSSQIGATRVQAPVNPELIETYLSHVGMDRHISSIDFALAQGSG